MIEDVLIDADTLRSPEMRHEIPALIVDPLLYGERDGVAFVAVSPLDVALVATARPEVRRFDMVEDLNIRELVDGGLNRHEALLEVRLQACRRMGLTRAVVPPTFPLATAEHLRRGGI